MNPSGFKNFWQNLPSHINKHEQLFKQGIQQIRRLFYVCKIYTQIVPVWDVILLWCHKCQEQLTIERQYAFGLKSLPRATITPSSNIFLARGCFSLVGKRHLSIQFTYLQHDKLQEQKSSLSLATYLLSVALTLSETEDQILLLAHCLSPYRQQWQAWAAAFAATASGSSQLSTIWLCASEILVLFQIGAT